MYLAGVENKHISEFRFGRQKYAKEVKSSVEGECETSFLDGFEGSGECGCNYAAVSISSFIHGARAKLNVFGNCVR